MKAKPWTCTKCGKPVRKGTGYITVADAEHGGYPRKATEDGHLKLKPAADNPTPLDKLGAHALADLFRVEIAFDVQHAACDPKPEGNEYWFGVEEATTLSSWMRWVTHLCGKSWRGKRDVKNMIKFWFRNRGERV